MSDEQGVSKVVDLMRSTRIAMLTTTDGQGRLTSRPMATQDVEFAGDVWFITERPRTREPPEHLTTGERDLCLGQLLGLTSGHSPRRRGRREAR